jgi:hypothetical protein
MVICACGLHPNPAKVPKFQNKTLLSLWIRNFMVMMKNPKNLVLRLGPMSYGHNLAKVPKFKYKALWYSIDRKFHADNHFA